MSLPIAFTMQPIIATTVISRTSGQIGGFFVLTATGTITIYDGTDATGRNMLAAFTPVSLGWYDFPAAFANGLYIVITAAMPVSIAWV